MKIRIDNGTYFNIEYFQKFIKDSNEFFPGSKNSQQLDEEEFLDLENALKNRENSPDSIRYFNETFEIGRNLAEQKGRKSRNIILNTVWFMPILFGYRRDFTGFYDDNIIRVIYDSQRPFVDLLVIGYKNKDYSMGFAMRRTMGARSPEHLDITEVLNEGGYIKFFKKNISLHPFQTLMYKDCRKEMDIIDHFNIAILT
jgi:hypothetical protein